MKRVMEASSDLEVKTERLIYRKLAIAQYGKPKVSGRKRVNSALTVLSAIVVGLIYMVFSLMGNITEIKDEQLKRAKIVYSQEHIEKFLP